MPLATLAQVKEKLRIPASDTAEDTAISRVLSSAEQYLLKLTGFTLTNLSLEEILVNPKQGTVYYLQKRPVSNVTAYGRVFGDTSWTQILIDVISAEEGAIMFPPQSTFPPVTASAPWFSWRLLFYDVVKVAYTAQALASVPDDLSDTTAALAAYWYRQHLASAVTEVATGETRETYSLEGHPPFFDALLARYMRKVSRWQ